MALSDDELARWGIDPDYTDTGGNQRRSPDHALAAVLGHLQDADADEGSAHTSSEPITFVTVDGPRTNGPVVPDGLDGSALVLEDGTEEGPVTGRLPAGLPLGYHWLHPAGGGPPTQLVATPGRCHLPPGLRSWGLAVQLYSARSRESWGMGDLADAGRIGRWLTATTERVAAGTTPTLLVNPLHAVDAGPDPAVSPYFAGSRCFANPIYLHLEHVPGPPPGGEVAVALARLAADGKALNGTRRIDRAAVWTAKSEALSLLWEHAGADEQARVDLALAADPVLTAHSAFNERCEALGTDWTAWPTGLRHPDGEGWTALAGTGPAADRSRFHAWLQLLVADQLAAAGAEAPLLLDLAIGASPGGFDTWYWQDLFVLDGTRIGAPPDEFNTQGQDWGLPPLDPWRLRQARYEPFVRMLRSGLAHSAGLRIDHVLGLFRLFWIPAGCSPGDGVYVRQPTADLLDLVALESVRAGAVIVGEDLGTVGPGVREELHRRRLLSYRVMSLDDTPPSAFPADSLASFTTHDLPTLPGLWTGADLAAQDQLDLQPNHEATEHARRRLGRQVDLADDAPADHVVAAAYRRLAAAPSAIVLAQLEDTAGVVDRPNLPGTTDQWPNWVQPLPEPIEDLLERPLTVEVAEHLARRGGGGR